MSRYWYAYGFKTREQAESAIEKAYAAGDVLPGEDPTAEPYAIVATTHNGRPGRAWGIKCNG